MSDGKPEGMDVIRKYVMRRLMNTQTTVKNTIWVKEPLGLGSIVVMGRRLMLCRES
jgi:hypothetical protein